MQPAFAGWPAAACNESLLDTIARRLRDAARGLADTLKQKGKP